MKFLFFRKQACIWKNFEFASPSFRYCTLDLNLAIVLSKEARTRQCCFSFLKSHSSSLSKTLLTCTISNLCNTSRASPNWFLTLPTSLCPQDCNFLAGLLSFKGSLSIGQEVWTGWFQESATTSKNPWSLGQKLSK
jgi:hypothetical protein